MDNRKQLKIMFLQEILQRKDDLFGAFTAFRTKETKNAKWKEVHNVALSLQLVQRDKTFTYTRDTLWQNIKKAAMKKRDNSRQTGSAGGTEMKINEIDELVYQIIGSESPVLDGIKVTESLIRPEAVPQPQIIEAPETEEDDQELHEPSISRKNKENLPPPTRTITRKVVKGQRKTILRKNNSTNIQKENLLLPNLKEEKLKLTIDYLKLKIEKTKKEIAMLDKAASKQTNKGRVPSSQVMETDDEPIVVDEEYNTIRADEEYYEIETYEPAAVNKKCNTIKTDKCNMEQEADDSVIYVVEYAEEDKKK